MFCAIKNEKLDGFRVLVTGFLENFADLSADLGRDLLKNIPQEMGYFLCLKKSFLSIYFGI